jgi:hypothetical protein
METLVSRVQKAEQKLSKTTLGQDSELNSKMEKEKEK